MGKTIKIFVASSEELKEERKMLAELANSLNTKLEKLGIQIIMLEWENLDASMGVKHKQEEYNDKLRECDMCLVLYWTKFGMYTEMELETAVQQMNAGKNPHKIYVYFKDSDSITPELKEFRDSFPTKYGHFYSPFANSDTLKAHFLSQFMEYQSNFLLKQKIAEVKDGYVYVDGTVYVDLKNVPFVGNNEEYNDLCEDIEDLEERLLDLDQSDSKYKKTESRLREKKEKRAKIESSLWDTALLITKLSTTKCSERLERAIALFNAGDNKGAQAILDEEDIAKDIEHNLNLIKLGDEGKNGLIVNLQEYRLKISAYKNELSSGWVEKVDALYTKCIEFGEIVLEDGEYAELLCEYGSFLLQQRMTDNVEKILLQSQKIYQKLYVANRQQYANSLAIANINLCCYYAHTRYGFRIISRLIKGTEDIVKNIEGDLLLKAKCMIFLGQTLRNVSGSSKETIKMTVRSFYSEAISLLDGYQSDDPLKEIAILKCRGELYKNIYDTDHAKENFENALSLQKIVCGNKDIECDWQLYQELYGIYCMEKNYSAAEQVLNTYNDHLDKGKLAQTQSTTYNSCKVEIFLGLTFVYECSDKTEAAMLAAKKAFGYASEVILKNHNDAYCYFRNSLRSLIYECMELYKYDEIDSILSEAFAFLERTAIPQDTQEGIIDHLYYFFQRYGKWKQAIYCRERYLDILNDRYRLKPYLQKSARSFRRLWNLHKEIGSLCRKIKEYNTADKHFESAVNLINEAYSAKCIRPLSPYKYHIELGLVFAAQHKMEKAEFHLVKALDLIGDDANSRIECFHNLSRVSAMQCKEDLAAQYKKKEIKLIEYEVNRSKSSDYTLCREYNNLAWLLYLYGKHTEALPYAEKSVSISREKNAIVIGPATDTLACIHRELGKYELALKEFEDVILFYLQKGKVNSLAHEQVEYAKLHFAMGNRQKGIELLRQAHQTFEKLTDDERTPYKEDIDVISKYI